MGLASMAKVPELICYFNGEFIKESEVKFSWLDHIHRGYGVFDVSRTFNHVPHFWKEHIDRLFYSMRYCHLDIGMTPQQMYDLTLEVFKRNEDKLDPGDDFSMLQQISGGVKAYYTGPTATPPTSDLWRMRGETTLATTGYPISRAKRTASSGVRASVNRGTSNPASKKIRLASGSRTHPSAPAASIIRNTSERESIMVCSSARHPP